MKPITALLVALAIFAGCRGKGAALDPKGGRSLDNVSAADWEKLAGKKIFFGHQSVGYDIMEGVSALRKEHPSIRLTIVETTDPSRFDAPVFAHAQVGRNEDPDSKCEAFERYMDSGIGSRADIAFFKFCYVDINRETDVGKVFESYKAMVRRVKTKYPGLILVHVTIPLTSSEYSLEARMKTIAKRLLGKSDTNIGRSELNERIRKEFGGTDPDLRSRGDRIHFSHGGIRHIYLQGEKLPLHVPRLHHRWGTFERGRETYCCGGVAADLASRGRDRGNASVGRHEEGIVPRCGRCDVHPWLEISDEEVIDGISRRMREVVSDTLRKKGVVVAVSGGIDSSVCTALAVRALGASRVLGLILPEADSSPESRMRGEMLCRHLGVRFEVTDITPILSAFGCYRWRDEAIRSVFPDFGPEWKSKIVLSGSPLAGDRINFFKVVVRNPVGDLLEKRLPLESYLQVVAATNFKQRTRKTLEYFHADRLNFAVVGTPNRLEYDQGFFVKNGDGAADLKPIAHLYKTQVYALADALALPEEIRTAKPTTDTYSLEQGQDEFFFALPYDKMDIVLFGLNHGMPSERVAEESGLTSEQVTLVYQDIRNKRRTTYPLHMKPVLMEPVPEIGS